MSLEPESRAQRKLIAAARISAGHLPPALPRALFVTDPARTPDPFTVTSRLPAGFGVVYRHFGASDREEVARSLARICIRRGMVLLIAADPELAAEIDAHGVHWPFQLAQQAGRWRRRFALQTVSAHSDRELRAVHNLPVDAALLSTVFASGSATAGAALGALRFRQIVRGASLPIYALGGVTANNAGAVSPMAGFAAVDGMAPFAGRRG